MFKYLILFVFWVSLGFSQTQGIVSYGVDFVSFSSDTLNANSEELKQYFINRENDSKRFLKGNQTYTKLAFDKNYSSYKIIPSLAIQEDKVLASQALWTEDYFLDINNSQNHVIFELKGKEVLVKYNREVEWEILDEYKTILGFTCQKAISRVGDEFDFRYVEEAWFTTDIPVSTGPHSFHGLPGLILELVFKGRRVYAQEIDFKTEVHLSKYKNTKVFETQRAYRKAR